MAIARHVQLENFGPPVANFFPRYQHWWVRFPNKKPYTYGKPDTYEHVAVSIDDKTGDAAFNEQTAAWRRMLWAGADASSEGSNSSVSAAATKPDEGAYRHAALRALLLEANEVASELRLQENLPITETNLVQVFILPFAGAQAWHAIGTIATRDYKYSVSRSNQLCYLTGMHQEEDMRRWKAEYFEPISRLDTSAAYQLATQWLASASMDVDKLNADCQMKIVAASPEATGQRKSLVPLYTVYWVRKDNRGRGSAASVQLFLPTKTLVQLRVDDPRYNLRKPLHVEDPGVGISLPASKQPAK